jgi:hypothetical protein
MSSSTRWWATCLLGVAAAVLVAGTASPVAQGGGPTPKFYADDPILIDDDRAFDASGAQEVELSEYYDFLLNTFATPGERSPIPAVNINTLGEVPDSSWFTNRIGTRDLSIDEVVRGPNKFAPFDADQWTVIRGKPTGGLHPGFRAIHPGHPGEIYQLEVDPPGYPRLTSAAELIGTLIYHALGYHVVDSYVTRIDPAKISISEKATIRDPSGVRRFTRHDLNGILRRAARDAQGRVYLSASRFEEGENMGQFEYHGTRPDDPNDVYPHEHRRELRANRVFAAWLAHDDSRPINTLNMRVEENGRKHIRHYMFDFGGTLGSATLFPDGSTSGHEYYIDKRASVRSLASLGLSVPPYVRVRRPADIPPSAGSFTSAGFEPELWKPNYPNPAFRNMRPDDAFWAARLVSRFSEELLRAIVGQAQYDDPRAAEYVTQTLIERRDKIARVWLNAVNPVVDFSLTADGSLAFSNAAVAAGAASPAASYTLQWSWFDNSSGVHHPIDEVVRVTDTKAAARSFPADVEYVSVRVVAEHPQQPAWQSPVQVYFRRSASGWTTVGLFR